MRFKKVTLEEMYQPQMLRQQGDTDCGVEVFRALLEMDRENILRDMPEAFHGKTVDQWKAYLESKGYEVFHYLPGDDYALPAAHLVGTPPNFCHWVFEAEDGGIYDPSSIHEFTPPKMLELSDFGRLICTITIRKPTAT